MRICFLLLGLLLAGGPALLAAQHPPAALVHGRVLHPTDSVLTLQVESWLPGAAPERRVRLGADGSFRARLDSLPAGAEVQLRHGRQELMLWLAPGDTLLAEVDGRHLTRNPRFVGRGAGACHYRAEQQRQRTADFYLAPEGRGVARSPAQQRARADAYRRRAEQVLAAAAARWALPPAVVQLEAAAIRYEWGRVLLGFAAYYEYERPFTGPVVRPLPPAYYDFVATLPLTCDSCLPHHNYRRYGLLYGQYLLRQRRRPLAFADFSARQFAWGYDTLRATLAPGPTRELLLAAELHELLARGRTADAAPRLAQYRREAPQSPWLAALAERGNQRQRTAPGQLPPPFQLVDSLGRAVSLADFRGNVVYLDVWASWCRPCRDEAPALRALRQRFAGQPGVVFVGVSIDARAAAWRRAVQADGLGTGPNQAQLLARPTDEALRALYQQLGVPFYWLLGPDGRLLDDNAPRPSAPGAAAAIEAALVARPAPR